MTVHLVQKVEFICDVGRLDCWGSELYNKSEEGYKEGWTFANGLVCCPSKYCQKHKNH